MYVDWDNFISKGSSRCIIPCYGYFTNMTLYDRLTEDTGVAQVYFIIHCHCNLKNFKLLKLMSPQCFNTKIFAAKGIFICFDATVHKLNIRFFPEKYLQT